MKYEVTTKSLGNGRIVTAVDHVASDVFMNNVRTTIIRQILDTQDQQVRDALIQIGWTPPGNSAAAQGCIVAGCCNKRAEGGFVGDVCRPCYQMLHSGRVSPHGDTFIHRLANDRIGALDIPLEPSCYDPLARGGYRRVTASDIARMEKKLAAIEAAMKL